MCLFCSVAALSGALLSQRAMFPVHLRQAIILVGVFFYFSFFEVHGFSSFRAKRIQSTLDKVEARLSSACRGGRVPSGSPG